MLEAVRLNKRFGAIAVTQDVSLRLERAERRVVLGPNGAGKTTLFNLLVGELKPDFGTIRIAGRDVTALPVNARARLGLARSYQRNNLFPGLTVAENLGLAAATAQGRAGSVLADSLREPAVVETVREVAQEVALLEVLDVPIEALAYGPRRQVEVGLALATRPQVLLMDEPTSGVGPGMVDAFRQLLARLPPTLAILIIEHDMDLAFGIADVVTVLDHGEVVFEGAPAAARASPLVKEIYLGSWSPHAGA